MPGKSFGLRESFVVILSPGLLKNRTSGDKSPDPRRLLSTPNSAHDNNYKAQ
jgi:hypothetical protein